MSLKIWVRSLLIFGAVYLLTDALVHLFNLRLTDTYATWPSSATFFSGFVSQIYASFVILTVAIIAEVQRNIKKYSSIVLLMGGWAVWHGGYLGYQVLMGLSNNFQNIPSLSVWLPFYDLLVGLESLLLLFFGTIVILWKIKNDKNN